jgi:ABC-type sugar transport system ATPase subunit
LLEAEVIGDDLNLIKLDKIISLSKSQRSILKEKGLSKLICGIRPEEISIVKEKSGKNCCSGKVKFKQSMGAEDILNIIVGDGMVKASVSPQLMIKDGDDVILNIEMSRSHIFNAETGEAVR